MQFPDIMHVALDIYFIIQCYFKRLFDQFCRNVCLEGEISITANSLVSGHPQELKKVSVSRAVRLQELFPKADTEEE